MLFTEMRDLLIEHFGKMVENKKHLFVVLVDKDQMWNTYLSSFKPGTNPMYRQRTEHDCSCCRGFIKSVGNVVSITDGKVETIWDFECNDDVYGPVIRAMSEFVKKHEVSDAYLSLFKKIGCHHNFEEMEKIGPFRWDHFYLELPDRFVAHNATRKNELIGSYHASKDVLLRSLKEISLDAVNTVLELCSTNTLYKGPEYEGTVKEFKKLKVKFEAISDPTAQNLYAWENALDKGPAVSRVRNSAIGTLLVDISGGMDLDEAVRRYETITAPSNYKRSKPLFTKKMLEDAKKTIVELGYESSLGRRFATLEDITVNDILFVNRDDAKKLKGNAIDVFEDLMKMSKDAISPKKFSSVEEISADTFVNDVLPSANSVEVLLSNNLSGNLVSLIAPNDGSAKSMFKWGNNFSWAYSGNLTDSMKERVKAAGGDVTGDLRFSIQWNEDGTDNCDLDAHAVEPYGNEIFFRHCKKPQRSTFDGQLDVDIITPGSNVAVENITWPSRSRMKDGTYYFFVNQFSGSVKKGFRAEIEFDGQIYKFDYPHSMRSGENVHVAEVTLKNGEFSIKCLLSGDEMSRTVWGLKTNEFVPVSVVCYSPNHWSTVKNPSGHKHLFFMLKGCVNEENPSGMFNEYLVQDLYDHRRVMEALSGQMRVEDSENQLSGIGFALDKRAEVVVKVKRATERILKIKF